MPEYARIRDLAARMREVGAQNDSGGQQVNIDRRVASRNDFDADLVIVLDRGQPAITAGACSILRCVRNGAVVDGHEQTSVQDGQRACSSRNSM